MHLSFKAGAPSLRGAPLSVRYHTVATTLWRRTGPTAEPRISVNIGQRQVSEHWRRAATLLGYEGGQRVIVMTKDGAGLPVCRFVGRRQAWGFCNAAPLRRSSNARTLSSCAAVAALICAAGCAKPHGSHTISAWEHLARAHTLSRLHGQSVLAEHEAAEACRLAPADSELQVRGGMLMMLAGRTFYPAAIDSLKRGLSMRKGTARPFTRGYGEIWLAEALAACARPSEAIGHYVRALRYLATRELSAAVLFDTIQARAGLADAMCASGDFHGAARSWLALARLVASERHKHSAIWTSTWRQFQLRTRNGM